MNFVFNYGDQYSEPSADSFCSSLLVTLIGTFIGFFLALLADRQVGKKKAKQKEIEIKNMKFHQLMYLEGVIAALVDIIPKQTLKLKEFANTIRSTPLEISQPEILATFDLMRLRNADNVDTQKAYFYFFKDLETYKEYKTLFAYGDYLFRLFESIENQITKETEHKLEDHIIIRDLIEEVSLLIGNRGESLLSSLGSIAAQKNEEFKFISEIAKSYEKIISKMVVFQEIKDLFITPLMSSSLSVIKERELSNKIFALARRAQSRLLSIEENAKIFANEMEAIEQDVKPSLAYLGLQLDKLGKLKDDPELL